MQGAECQGCRPLGSDPNTYSTVLGLSQKRYAQIVGEKFDEVNNPPIPEFVSGAESEFSLRAERMR
jgi:hypothetical protein